MEEKIYNQKTVMHCQKEHLNNETGECLLNGLCIHQSILEKGKTYCLKYQIKHCPFCGMALTLEEDIIRGACSYCYGMEVSL